MFLRRKRRLPVALHPSVRPVPDDEMRQRESASLNKLCDISHWRLGPFNDMLAALNDVHLIHRKSWEYAWCVLGLERLRVVPPGASAIAVGAGSERPLYYFANKIDRMLATDVYGKYAGNEAPEDMLTNPEKYAPFEYRKDHLTVECADALDLPYADCSFDFGFSLSSIEHFGGPEQTEAAMRHIHRVLKPGGVFCLTTELILTRGTLPEAYTFEQLQRHIIDSTPLALVEDDIDLSISASLLEHPIDLGSETDLHVSPHIVLKRQTELFTSLMLFFRKEGESRGSRRVLRAICERQGDESTEAGPPVSDMERKQIQRDHVARMIDAIQTPEAYARHIDIMNRRYSVYLSDLLLQGSGRMLDVGCGYSDVWFGLLRGRGFTYYGVDLNEDVVAHMARLLSSQGDEEYAKAGMLEKIPYPDSFFDVVYASHILEHTTDIALALAEIRRVLKDDGYLVFAVPCGLDHEEPAHLHKREKEGWVEDLTANGFVIETSGQFDFNLNEFYGRAVKRRDSEESGQDRASSPVEETKLRLLQAELQATQERLRATEERLRAIESSTTWRVGQRVARTWAGRLLHYSASRLRRSMCRSNHRSDRPSQEQASL